MAKIVRLVETLTNHAKAEWKLEAMKAEEKGLAKPKEPKRYPLELSNGVIIRLVYETFGESTVRNSLNYLVEIGYIGREQEKANAIPLYWLEQEYVQSLLKTQAEIILAGFDFVPPSFQGLKSYPGPVKSNPKRPKSNPRGYEITGLGSESTDNNISNNIDNNITYKTEKDESMPTSDEVAPTPADLSSEELHEKVDGAIIGVETVKRITDKHKAVQPNETPYHIAGAAIGKKGTTDDVDNDLRGHSGL